MRHFYTILTADLSANPPAAREWHALVCPGAPQWSLVVLTDWNSHSEQDTWEAISSVVEHHIEQWGRPVPTSVVTAFGPWGVAATDTLRQAMQKVRAMWPAARL